MNERLLWFKQRIGKRVFRNKTSCPCESCQKVFNEGIIITDENHAIYLSDVESDYQAEGAVLKYFDTKEEDSIATQPVKEDNQSK